VYLNKKVSDALRDVRHNEGPTNTVLMNPPSGGSRNWNWKL